MKDKGYSTKTIIALNGSQFVVEPVYGGRSISVNNDAQYESRQEVILTEEEQYGLLHVLADRLGYSVVGPKEMEHAKDAAKAVGLIHANIDKLDEGELRDLVDVVKNGLGEFFREA